jgi:uncharacterized membrane protein
MLGIEFVFVRDLFNSRMNSVFKFAYQAWILLALAGSLAPVAIAAALRGGGSAGRPALARVGASAALVAALALLAGGLVFTVASVRTRTQGWSDRGLTLDGLAWWQFAHPADLAAAEWLGARVDGAVVVVEAHGDSYEDEMHISMSTGLPTLLGWEYHEKQWGRSDEMVQRRKDDLQRLYSREATSEEILAILKSYDARYVVVGPAERSQYDMPPDLDRFDRVLNRAYDADGIAIFEVPQ